MALSEAFVAAHISTWQERLRLPYYAHRQHWPSNLFHHSALENAAVILSEGCLRSRNDPDLRLGRDVAAPAVLANRAHAHDFVRMYFRPKTPTQFHIEGIKRPDDQGFGVGVHAPVLVMFVLDAMKVLTLPGVHFSDRNMQRNEAVPGNTEEYFNNIPFDKVYHEGGIGGDTSIISHRSAEVLSASPLMLQDVLKGVWFRSVPERDTMLHMLGPDAERWENYFQVSDALKVFEKRYPFFQNLSLSEEGITFQINPRPDYGKLDLKIVAEHVQSSLKIEFIHPSHAARPDNGGSWIYRTPIPDGVYLVSAHIDGHLAYQAMQTVENSIF